MTRSISAPSKADQAAIAAVPGRVVAAWAAHDATAFAEVFVEDGTMILPGVAKKGRDEIRTYMAAEFSGHYKGTTLTGTPVEIKPLGPDAVALISIGGVLPPGKTELTSDNAVRASWILVRRNGGWQLAVYHNCPRDAA